MAFNSFTPNAKISGVKSYSTSTPNTANIFERAKQIASNMIDEIDYSNYEAVGNSVSEQSNNSNYMDNWVEQNRNIIDRANRLFNIYGKIMNNSNLPDKIVNPFGNIIRDGKNIIIERKGIRYIYNGDTGLCHTIQYETGVFALIKYDSNGEPCGISYSYNKNGQNESLKIFGDNNIKTEQYGGNQGVFDNNTAELLQDPIILDMLRTTYPDASMEDYENLLKKITAVGCGYVALINSIFVHFEGREEDFKNEFGFPMYSVDETGNVDYNYEYLILEYILYRYKDYGVWTDDGRDTRLQTIINYIDGANALPLSDFEEFLSRKGINVDVEEYVTHEDEVAEGYDGGYIKPLKFSELQKTIKNAFNNPGKQVIISVGRQDVPKYAGKTWKLTSIDGTEEMVFKVTEGHAMYLTGFTENGDYIVSSWGKKYILEVSDIDVISDVKVISFD